MKRFALAATVATFMFALLAAHPAEALLSASPGGFFAAGAAGDTVTYPLTLTNPGDAADTFQVSLRDPNGRDANGPGRDNPGDIITRYRMQYSNTIALAWDPDREWMWGVNHENPPKLYAFNPANGQVEVNVDVPNVSGGMFYLDGVLYLDGRNGDRSHIYRYNVRGERLDDLQTPFDLFETCFDSDGERFYLQHWQGGPVQVYRLADWEHLGSIDYEAVIGNATMYSMAWVPIHRGGQLWLYGDGVFHQLNVHDNFDAEEVQTFRAVGGRWAGLEHDGHDLWLGWWNGDGVWYKIDDGIAEAYWLQAAPMDGVVRANSSTDIEVSFIPGDLDAGTYEMLLDIESMGGAPLIEMACVLTVGGETSAISGTVVRARDGAPVEGATVALNRYQYYRVTDQDGRYSLDNLPTGRYQVNITADDYLPETAVVDLGADDTELNVNLRQATCSLSDRSIVTQVAPGTSSDVGFTATNRGDGLLEYSIDRRLVGDANAAPWEVRRMLEVGNALNDTRIEGVAFDGEYFLLSGANGVNPNTIYVLDRDGRRVNQFNQLGNSNLGMRDIEYDGENFWGSGEANVWCFDRDGAEVSHFHSTVNPAYNIAYDSDDELLWMSAITTNIVAYDRQGNASNRLLNRKNLRIYGMSYWPEDPDGYNLYLFTQPAANQLLLYKMNTVTNDTMLVQRFDDVAGGYPAGVFITNTYDIYSWVMMSIQNRPPAAGGDQLYVHQLAARRDWFSVQPEFGAVEPGASQDFTLHFDATGLPEADFSGELVFAHTGIGGQTILPVTMQVVNGPVQSVREIHLDMGWNMVSANLQPDPAGFADIFQPLLGNGVLRMAKDDRGNFFTPDFQRNMPDWVASEGYIVKVAEPCSLSLSGLTRMQDDPIHLNAGWQMVSYYPRRAVDVVTALSGVSDRLLLAKDGFGNFYLPAYQYENIGVMQELSGYQLKMSGEADLVYQMRQRGQARFATYASPRGVSSHYPSLTPTGSNMSLLVDAPELSGDVGVYANQRLVGVGVLDRGRSGVAVWGDDPSTPAIDGAVTGDRLEVRISDDAGERLLPVRTVLGDLMYQRDAITVARAEDGAVPESFDLLSVYPNPFNGHTSASVTLPEAAMAQLSLHDISGRQVRDLFEGKLRAGRSDISLDLSDLASGIYVLRLSVGGASSQVKLALVR